MRATVVVPLATACLALAACTSSDPAPADPTPLATTTPSAAATTAAPTPTPSPTSVVQDGSDPELGIAFEDVPDLAGAEADVYNAVSTYQREYWRTMTTNKVSPAFSVIASGNVQSTMKGIAAANAKIDGDIGGTLKVTISDVAVDGEKATAVLCDDYGDVTFADPKKTYTPAEAGFGEPRRESVTLGLVDGKIWMLLKSEVSGTC